MPSKESTTLHKKTRDLTGQTCGRLTVFAFVGSRSRKSGQKRLPYWQCQCLCGTVQEMYSRTLLAGTSRSCGCLNAE
jgi:hypothetical protein